MLAAFRAAARELSVRVRQTGGQTTLFLVLFLFLFGALGAAVVDVGLLINARREAQSDADRAALAGTLELSLSANPSVQAADEAAAITKATHASRFKPCWRAYVVIGAPSISSMAIHGVGPSEVSARPMACTWAMPG